MLVVNFLLLFILWLVAVVTGYTLGGIVHMLLALALVSLTFHFLTGKPRSR